MSNVIINILPKFWGILKAFDKVYVWLHSSLNSYKAAHCYSKNELLQKQIINLSFFQRKYKTLKFSRMTLKCFLPCHLHQHPR